MRHALLLFLFLLTPFAAARPTSSPLEHFQEAQSPPPAETAADVDDKSPDGATFDEAKLLWERFRDDPRGTIEHWLMDKAPGFFGKILLFLALLWAARIAANICARLVARALRSEKLNITALLRTFAANTTRNVVFFLGALCAMGAVGIDITMFLAAFGAIGLIVGFALSETLNNFAAGVMILLYRPFDIGHVVTAGGVTGKVAGMNLVSTTMLTPDNQTNVVPNGKIWGDVITNITANATRRVDLVAGIGYESDIALAEKVLLEIVETHAKVHKDPAPVIRLHALAESSVNFVIRAWANTSDYWEVYWDVTRAIKMRFDEEGISIPYPQRDVHLHEVKAS